MRRTLRLLLLLLTGLVLVAACGGDDDEAGPGDADGAPGVRLVSPEEGEAIRSAASDDLVVLDVRTPTEFAEGHLEDAILIDINEPDFADRIAELDREASYLLYCRSGNRSERAAQLMRELDFTDVADVDGGIVAWADAGLPIVTG